MSWKSVPICDSCWAYQHGNREPIRIVLGLRSVEKCHFCGQSHKSGIFIRAKVLEREPRSITEPFIPSVEQ